MAKAKESKKIRKRKKANKARRARKGSNMRKGRFGRHVVENNKPSGVATLTLERQIDALGPRPALDSVEPWMDRVGSQAQIAWDRRVTDLQAAIRKRDATRSRIVDPGRDISGNYDVSPFAARGHAVEVAPKSLGRELPAKSQFPRQIATQRVIDSYKAHRHISPVEWLAAKKLWELWVGAGAEFRVCSDYDPIFVQSSPSTDHTAWKRIETAAMLNAIWAELPVRAKGCVRAVVIEDISAADWARARGYGQRQSKAHGMARLRLGLQGLSRILALTGRTVLEQ